MAEITNIRNGPPRVTNVAPSASGITFIGMQIEKKKPLWGRIKKRVKKALKRIF